VLGRISQGLLVFVGVERYDRETEAQRLAERVLGLRMFSDEQGRMNRSVVDIKGGLLLVPQFTLPADTRRGTRPSLSPAAPADALHPILKRHCHFIRMREGRETQPCSRSRQ
jgi:D-tyrosyl-tRNA(Tyr) deacylase